MTYREYMEQDFPEDLMRLEKIAKETGEKQTFRTGEYQERCEGFMEPKDYYERFVYVSPDGEVTGRWVQIY